MNYPDHKFFLRTWQFKTFLLLVIYTVGILGFTGVISMSGFEKLTPFNLLFSVVVMMWGHERWSNKMVVFLANIFFAGFFIEWAGVTTGNIFGSYYYGESLGWKFAGIPIIIGINWIILVYTTGTIANFFLVNTIMKITLATTLMVALDFLIEPFAIRYDLWQWEKDTVPLQNYLGWWVCGWLMQWLFFKWNIVEKNPTAVALYIIQVVFFGLLMLVAEK